MDSELRRERILSTIKLQAAPISASALAKSLNVSRQVIVGDVALLRAGGNEIVATARGYVIPELKETNRYVSKVACRHTAADTKSELYAIVDLGATVADVIVEHELYGEIAGGLNLSSRADVDEFMKKAESSNSKLLSELTQEVHLHTIFCRDRAHFDKVYEALSASGYIVD